jgi:hypothetical protein
MGHAPRVYRIVGQRDLAEDVAQDAFFRSGGRADLIDWFFTYQKLLLFLSFKSWELAHNPGPPAEHANH